MKRFLATIILILIACAASGQDAKKEEPKDTYNTNKDYRSRVFEVRNRSPREIANAVQLLGSGFKGTAIMVNEQLRTITVRDFPENLASIEDAIKRLDRPAEAVPGIDLRISILIGSKGEIANAAPTGDDLAGVVHELQSTLRYTHYALMTATVHHARPGIRIENSGVAEASALGMKLPENTPVTYSYTMREPALGTSGDRPALNIDEFQFNMRIPISTGTGYTYQSVGFNTPLTIRDGQKMVVGTTTMGDKALIVVIEAKFGK